MTVAAEPGTRQREPALPLYGRREFRPPGRSRDLHRGRPGGVDRRRDPGNDAHRPASRLDRGSPDRDRRDAPGRQGARTGCRARIRLDSRTQPQPRPGDCPAGAAPTPLVIPSRATCCSSSRWADSSLRYDRLEKVPSIRPGRHSGNVAGRRRGARRHPSTADRVRTDTRGSRCGERGDRLAASGVPALGFAVDDLFGE